ncbi:MAG: penicillin-binding protein, 1A family, partial [uncultured bacterium]
LTGAYNAFVNGGKRAVPVTILKVEDSSGRVLEEVKPVAGKQVLTNEEAYIIADILSDNEARSAIFGTNSLLNIPGKKIAVKTGTTNDKRDNWTIGGNPDVMVGVWVGNNDNSPMKQVASGVSGASPIWRRTLLEALATRQSVSLDQPSNIVSASVDTVTGYRSHDGFPSRTEIFIKGTEPGEDPVHQKLKICKADGKLATPSDIARGDYEEKEFFSFKEEDPTSAPDQQNRWQEGILNWLTTQADPRYHPPSEYCGTQNPVNVEFVTPQDRDSNLPGTFKVKVTADSSYAIKLVEFEVDGIKVRSFDAYPFEQDVTLEKGVHVVRAIAHDQNSNVSDRLITIGVGVAWDTTPSPMPTPTPSIIPSMLP